MKHQKLFIGMLGLLIVGAGGVFILLNQGSQSVENVQLTKEALVAGVAVTNAVENGEVEHQERAVLENQTENQEDQKEGSKLLSPAKQPSPAPKAISPSPSELTPKPVLSPAAPEPTQEPTPTPKSPVPPPQINGKVNINTANSGDLQQLSGIGPVLASRIIDYRKQVNLFYSIDDIKNVSGIGDAIFAKIKDNITVGNVLPPSPPPPAPTPAPAPTPSPTPAPVSEKININTADYDELQNITGVGEVIAQRIIDYRQANGAFGAIEEIKNVKGIGDATFEKMKSEITI